MKNNLENEVLNKDDFISDSVVEEKKSFVGKVGRELIKKREVNLGDSIMNKDGAIYDLGLREIGEGLPKQSLGAVKNGELDGKVKKVEGFKQMIFFEKVKKIAKKV